MSDDKSIKDEDLLYRRLNPMWVVNNGSPRISSAAFQNFKGGDKLSANLESLLIQNSQTWQDLLQPMPEYGLAALSVGGVRGLDQGVEKDPLPDDPSHVHVIGNKSRSVRKKLARAAQLNILQFPKSDTQ